MTSPAFRQSSASEAIDADCGLEAFRYVAGELTVDEAAAFEERLAVDQSAREAVARAVEIAQSVAVLGAQPLPVARNAQWGTSGVNPGGSRRAAFAAVVLAAAACIALAIALNPFGDLDPGGMQADHHSSWGADAIDSADRAASSQPANAARLVELWSDADDLFALDSVDPAALEALNSVWQDENGTDGESDFGWMLAAVSAELPPPDSESPALPPQHPLAPQIREN